MNQHVAVAAATVEAAMKLNLPRYLGRQSVDTLGVIGCKRQ